jgi:hypothetical protein
MNEILGISLATLPYLAVFLFALLLVFSVFVAHRSPAFGVGVMSFGYLMSTMFSGAGFSFGITLYVPDILIAGIIAPVVLMRLLAGHFIRRDAIVRAWLVLGVVWFGMFFVGVPMFKTLAGVAFRVPFYAWTAVAYLLSFRLDELAQRRVVNVLMWAALAMGGLVVFRWCEIALDVPDLFWRENRDSIRVVPAAAAQMLVLALAVGLAGMVGLSRARPAWTALGMLNLVLVLFLQHRTVWAVTLAMIAAAFWLARRAKQGRTSGALLPLLLALLLVGGLAMFAPNSKLTAGLQNSVREAGQERSTLTWRVDSWREMGTDWIKAGPKAWPFGYPSGQEMRRFNQTQNAEVSVSAHSNYVSLLVNGGVVGFCAFLWAQLAALRRLMTAPSSGEAIVNPSMLAIFIIACMVYAFAYGFDFMQGLFLGLAYSVAVGMKPKTAVPLKSKRFVYRYDAVQRRGHVA